MPYTATTWVDGSTAANQTHMNNLETQYTESTNSLEQDLFSAFVFSGLVATKDGTIANQLDVTAGVAFLKQADNTLRRRAPVSSTQTTATPSTTYYLFLNVDGTWTWGTASTGPTNSLAVCQVTTDGSGNISTVTDKRALNTTLFAGALGNLTIPGQFTAKNYLMAVGPNTGLGITSAGDVLDTDSSKNLYLKGATTIALQVPGGTTVASLTAASGSALLASKQGGASAIGIAFQSWDGAASHTPFSVGGQFNSALSWVDNSGNFNGPAGGGIPATRNNAAGSVPIYTGTTSPTTPPTGSIWVKA